MSEIILTPEHEYLVDNKPVPGVSKILKHFGCLPDYDRFGNDTSLSFGKNVHKLLELFDKNNLGEYDMALDPWLNGYKKFLSDYSPKWWVIETIGYSKKWGFCGTPDRYGMIRSKNAIVDFKTGAPIPAHKLQTAAYQILIEEELNLKNQKRYSLIIKENDYKLIEHTSPADKSLFIGLAQNYNWKVRNGLIKE